MSTARYLIGDVRDVLPTLPDQSVHSVITSPPYWRKRRYLPLDHPDADREIGQEASPGEFLATLLSITDELWRIVRDDGTIWFNLGDTAAGSGGAEHPLAKSVCWLPELFGASLAYGRNLLTGEPCRQWITRPPVTWCKPSPMVGEIIDKFREATELFVWAAKQPRYYFDIDSLREPHKSDPTKNRGTVRRGSPDGRRGGGDDRYGHGPGSSRPIPGNPIGAPPLNYWVVNSSSFDGAHFATFPPELITRPVIASCPPGGTILDPFGGSGTTASVATGHGRDCWMIDIDERNAELARERVGMFLEPTEHFDSDEGPRPDVSLSSAADA